ncbi:MAG: NAD(P)-dependent glycerol-3-phosphate dehydrogenase [Gemmatimonadetes bacterium]|nr:NAD(P)-dependent glycerol-3-phosphate dehydrogenase [Gemmatimonadota bacterium]NNF12825.1 NAD(P)-dependent glycerol-3-phosphate dehydrogenase [Gemmatimonadota bacterium]NNL30020.1 NAD(P)-dependent glycerol-3-phosphate dehydrogenase [Gemmatimonadota bacterium]
MSEPEKVAVLGAGAWGTALATVLSERGHDTWLWSYEAEVAESIDGSATNPYLPDVKLPAALSASAEMARVLDGAGLVVSVSPSQVVRSVLETAAPSLGDGALLVSASKGIELGTLLRMDQVAVEVLGESIQERFAVLSGPSFAEEVARRQPTAVVVASEGKDVRDAVQAAFQTPWFRVYTNPDVVGVELGGAVKNVIALAAGMTAGLGYAHNSAAALITRGLAEITRLGVAMGAQQATFYGLAGLGDLVLTCTGGLSRNRTVGYRLGAGESLDVVLGEMTAVAEGIKTASAVHELASRHGVEMPIAEQVYAIVEQGKTPAEALQDLMLRDPKPEEWS